MTAAGRDWTVLGQALCGRSEVSITDMGKRIAIFLPNLTGGGAERVALTLAEQFIAQGHAVDLVLARSCGDLVPLVPPQARLIDLDAGRLRHALTGFWRYLRRERPDAVQVSMWPLTVVGIIAHRMARSSARLVVSDHANFTVQFGRRKRRLGLIGWSMRLFYPLADARVCVSDKLGDDLALISGLRRGCFPTIYNPIPRPPGRPSVAAEELGWTGKERRILAVGNLKDQKNHALLLRAFAVVNRRQPANLLILGEGPLRPSLERQVGELGVGQCVSMPGYRLDPSPYYSSADLLVLSSDYEGFGNVLVEALAAGLPIVSTDCPSGPAEILEDGKWGQLVPVGNAQALAEAIEDGLAKTFDAAALKARADEFRPEIAAQKYLALLIGEARPSA